MSAPSEAHAGFGQLLRSYRNAAALTQEELATRSGLTARAISDMERGRTTRPYHRSVRLLAEAMELAGPARGRLLAAARTGPDDAEHPPARASAAADEPRPEVPRQLPAAPRQLFGREDEMKTLNGLLDLVGGSGGVVIAAISGTAGVGKTALAVHWAHQVAGRFPGGQLYVDLRGFDPVCAPVTPAEAIHDFLDALQAPTPRKPLAPDAQAALYRTALADRAMLIVLDNARDAGQVRPLLPGGRGCLVLVTSRCDLTGLIASEGAHSLDLDVLGEAGARELLTGRLGAERLAREPQPAAELTELCARLPLALAIAAARAAARPHFLLAAIIAELRDEPTRLDGLDAGEPASDLRTVLSWSYRQLTPPAARMFRLLGVHAGPDISMAAAASLAALQPAQARGALAELTAAHLLTEHSPGRFAFHDLLRAYAAEQARASEGEAGSRAALRRALDHYLHTASHAQSQLCPADELKLWAPPDPGTAPETPDGQGQALAWFAAEGRVLVAAVSKAADWGFDTHAWQLPAVMREPFTRRGHWDDWVGTLQVALAAAQRLRSPVARACAHRSLADAYIQLEAYEDARAQLESALSLDHITGDQAGAAWSQFSLAGLCAKQDDFGAALCHAERALGLFRELDHQVGLAWSLNSVGWMHANLGNHRQAVTHCREALVLLRQLGSGFGEAVTLDSLGYTHHRTGHHHQAIALFQRAVDFYREAGDSRFKAATLNHLGDSYQAAGRTRQARESWRQARAILSSLQPPGADQVPDSQFGGEQADTWQVGGEQIRAGLTR